MEETAEYRTQISAIEKLLAENGPDEELEQAKKDLEELVELMMEEMVEEAPTTSCNVPDGNEEDVEETLNLDGLLGTRCMAPFSSDRTIRTHTAVIMDIVPGSEESTSKVRVLFSHPTCLSMKPCSHFLSSSCKFGDNCRFSHGYSVALNMIEDYVDPNFESIDVECLVLVKSSNDVWELGRITAIDGQQVAIKLLKSNQEISSTRENTVPVMEDPDERGTDEPSGSSWPELKGPTLGNVGLEDVGKWEGGGIGMKLMMKMGYQVGQGLGKKSDGIVHAIQAKICPKNASVDECMNKRKRKVVDGKANNPTKKVKRLDAASLAERDIFAFINRKLEKKAKPTFAQFREEKKELESYSNKALGIKGVDLELELKQLKVKEKKLKEGIARNKTDKNTVDRLTQSLRSLQDEIGIVTQRQNRLHNERNSRDLRKKDIF